MGIDGAGAVMARRDRFGGSAGPSIRAIWWIRGTFHPRDLVIWGEEEEVDLPSARFGGATFHPRVRG
jgi:hypothetical protein